MQKRAIAVHDISCVGRCSLTVALPILSAAGINTAVIPTALLSTHTGEFTGYTHLDLSDQLEPISRHLETLSLHYDAFYTGYLASGAQVEEVLRMMDRLCDPATHLFVDPAFADQGRMYSLMNQDMPKQMRGLCSRANTIIPNLTEAAFLLNQPYPGQCYTQALIADYCRALIALGTENVVITDVTFDPEQTGVALMSRGMEAPIFLFRQRFHQVFYGTGDAMASFTLAALLNGKQLADAVELALDLTHEAIEYTLEDGEPLRYGVQFERVLPTLWQRLSPNDSPLEK
ncbi:MAG: pyridoxamine kinase [Eubacteriales bacterium]|nr:pyridoxamine kinase [Eubacteriales bacterium]